jgi:murein DD-endopeptidase MepM/ murein hydrolase activator NlpD
MSHLQQILKSTSALLLILFFAASCGENAEETVAQVSEIAQSEKTFIKTVYGYNEDSVEVFKSTIKPNQSLSDILSPYHISFQAIHDIAIAADTIFNVRKLAANRDYEVICSNDSAHQAKCFIYHPNPIDYVVYQFDDSVSVSMEHYEVERKENTASGIINSSLYQTLVDNGNSPKLAVELSDMYAWQIDFFGIQKGDNYKIVYEELYVNDELIGVGQIKAALFDHMDTSYYAFQYEQDSIVEYFDEAGNSLRKAFLKAPLSYRRISSKFSYSRLHPILKRRMPHLGVDYAASKGTPVYAIGDGKVIKSNYAGAAGNYVKIKHNSVYTSGYMHLWKFEQGINVGTKVKQGQLIGYVGSTGRSTGPHLDFRIWKNGTAVDPVSLKPPSAKPINEEHITTYLKWMKGYRKKLEKIKLQEAEAVVM